ncbi:uncharacterized protein ACNLHF_026787 [Anomaloglossus baeobatrachus]|uniref:uncharacterized protein LOC142249508 n=1 Tax=Anomaloglossus baeobatrachus TaxID=238106 RepID=UPI003F50C5D1
MFAVHKPKEALTTIASESAEKQTSTPITTDTVTMIEPITTDTLTTTSIPITTDERTTTSFISPETPVRMNALKQTETLTTDAPTNGTITTAAVITTGITAPAAPVTAETPSVIYVRFTFTIPNLEFDERLLNTTDPYFIWLKKQTEALVFQIIRLTYPSCQYVVIIAFWKGSVKADNVAVFQNSSVAPSSEELQSTVLEAVKKNGEMVAGLQLFNGNATSAETLAIAATPKPTGTSPSSAQTTAAGSIPVYASVLIGLMVAAVVLIPAVICLASHSNFFNSIINSNGDLNV